MNKYRLSDETRLWQWKNGDTTHSVTLRQIIATVDFNDVTVGTKGGWVARPRAVRRLLDLRRKQRGVRRCRRVRQRASYPAVHR